MKFQENHGAYEVPSDMKNIARPILGYLGFAESYHHLDYPLILFLASRHPEWQFLFVGLIEPLQPELLLPNIHFLGRRRFEGLPYYAAHFDICLVPHRINDPDSDIRSVKLLECLAAGKLIISTKIEGIVELEPQVSVADSWIEFEELIIQSLSRTAVSGEEHPLAQSILSQVLKQSPGTSDIPNSIAKRDHIDSGVLYLATGNMKYLALAACSALSLRWAGYTGPIQTLVDTLDFDNSLFARAGVELVKVDVPSIGVMPSRWIKTRLDLYSPFEHTLFLDCDIIAFKPPAQVWSVLGGAAFGIVRDPGTIANCKHSTPDELHRTMGICPQAAQYNTGVLAWRRGKMATLFFESWHEEWQHFKDIDQLALARAMHRLGADFLKEMFQELPIAFNSYDHSSVLEALGAGVVFWHLWGRVDMVFEKIFDPIYLDYCRILNDA